MQDCKKYKKKINEFKKYRKLQSEIGKLRIKHKLINESIFIQRYNEQISY